jgi:hypothetical protein
MEADLIEGVVMRVFFAVLVFAFFSVLSASEVVGSVEALKGRVKVKSENSIKKVRLKVGAKVRTADIVTTSKKASLKIKLIDGSFVVLSGGSTLVFDSLYDAKQDGGKIYYKITSRDAKNSLKIQTPFAIIGVKGTTFIIDATKESFSVSLKEGLIGVASIKEEFELYRKEVQKQFEDFMAQQKSAFEEYKSVQIPGFVEKTKEFDIHPKKTISFDGNKASERDWTQDDDKEFGHFEKLMDSMK